MLTNLTILRICFVVRTVNYGVRILFLASSIILIIPRDAAITCNLIFEPSGSSLNACPIVQFRFRLLLALISAYVQLWYHCKVPTTSLWVRITFNVTWKVWIDQTFCNLQMITTLQRTSANLCFGIS